jgi:hypothetical protein
MFPYALLALTQIATKPILNQNWRTHYGKFERRREICFNNKTILGALSLDMIAVLLAEPLHLLPFLHRIF